MYVGQNSVINSGCVLYSGNGIYIGDNVLVAANCTFAATNHAYRSRALLIRQQGFLPSKGGVIVHNDSWIGAGCILLDGAIVNQGCVIGAGSVVRNELPEYSICVGNPAMPVSYRK